MAERFERMAESHPNFAGAVAALLMVAAFGIVGGIERGSIALPF